MDNTSFYGENIFHMHIDGKVGILDEKDRAQKHASRFLFSIVPGAWGAADVAEPRPNDDVADTGPRSSAAQDRRRYGTTAYPIWQPRTGFNDNHECHHPFSSVSPAAWQHPCM
eukprot:COSAG05_NODE_1099_length_5888_cov_9.758335_4_plen_113_part_00